MAITYPSSLDSLTNPSGTSLVTTPDHAQQHSDANDAIEALEQKVGLGAGTPVANRFLWGTGNGTSGWSNSVGSITVNTGTINNSALGSPTITSGTLNNSALGSPTINNGTINNAIMGTPRITGGTLNTATVGTPSVTGGTLSAATFNNGTLGTNTYTGGTLNSPTIILSNNSAIRAAGSAGTANFDMVKLDQNDDLLIRALFAGSRRSDLRIEAGTSNITGSGASVASGSVSFTRAFSAVPIVVTNCSSNNIYLGNATGITASGFTGYIREVNNNTFSSTETLMWVAIGY